MNVFVAVALTGTVSAGFWVGGGAAAGVAASLAGILATAIHLAALTLLKPALVPPFAGLVGRWAMGMGLRVAGVGVLAVGLYGAPDLFPALPSAVGFLAVLIPLLFSEMRLLLRALQAGR